MGGAVVGLVVVLALAICAAPAAAQDSDAPPGALPHWIPDEVWVYEHWLPYDETRLYRLLGRDRGQIWRHLRDDAAHDLSQLGRRRGLTSRELADRLVAPRRDDVSPRLYALLRSRALRTVTQGHLSQHLLFHSLHQRAIQDRARSIFGVTAQEFRDLRVTELSPLEIGRLHGRSAVVVRRRAAAALRRAARRAVRDGAMTRAQSRRLLGRQLGQLPRWLGQRRNNGPPRTLPSGMPSLPIADWANHPTISADGSRVAFDAFRSTIPEARKLGEIRVVVADLGAGGRLLEASHARGVRAGRPRSGYHSALSADGRSVAFEVAEGNMNYAKRYGQMRVVLHDLQARRTRRLSHPRGRKGPSRSAYNPTVSGDGRFVAFEAADAKAGGGRGATALWLVDRESGKAQVVGRGSAGATYEARLSGDGRTLVFSAADAGTDGRALVYARDVATGTTTLVSRAPGGASADDDAYEPAVSADGRFVTFTSAAGNLGERGRRSRVWVRDMVDGSLAAVSDGARGSFAFDPAISADGRWVAFASRPSRRGRPAYARASVWRHDRLSGETVLVSRRTGPRGPAATGLSSEPTVSADGTRVAFTSTAGDLDRRKPGGLTGVFVRDVASGTTMLLSTHAERKVPPVPAQARQASLTVADAFGVCHLPAI